MNYDLRLHAAGRPVLRFDKSIVHRLWDHARTAPESMLTFGQKEPQPALWLVGDQGIYLMSNGRPGISGCGALTPPNEGTSVRRLVAYAKGCSESDERSTWRAVHHAVADGDDFTIVVLLNEIERALESAEKEIVIVVGTQHIETMSDVGYDVRRAH